MKKFLFLILFSTGLQVSVRFCSLAIMPCAIAKAQVMSKEVDVIVDDELVRSLLTRTCQYCGKTFMNTTLRNTHLLTCASRPRIEYLYDAAGNRIKRVIVFPTTMKIVNLVKDKTILPQKKVILTEEK